MTHSAEIDAAWHEGPCEDYDEHACPFYCQEGCLVRAKQRVRPVTTPEHCPKCGGVFVHHAACPIPPGVD